MSEISHMTHTPVIIPTYNESDYIASTLHHLPADRVYPIVADNGSRDNTAEIAEQFGAQVLSCNVQGKLPAIQEALRSLGDRAMSPLIILDADTRPIMPKSWHDGMLQELLDPVDSDLPTGVSAPAWFNNGSFAYAVLHSLRRLKNARHHAAGTRQESVPCCGPSMGLNLRNKEEKLEEILALPHIWPREDLALVDIVTEGGGEFKQLFSPKTAVLTPLSESYPGLVESWRLGKEKSREAAHYAYIQRAAPGSITYNQWKLLQSDVQE